MPNVLQLMPALDADEMTFVQGLIKDMTDTQAQQFAGVYNVRRRDPLLILVTTLIGFMGVGGVQRFILGQIGMGLLYVFTCGLCLIGTVIDIVNYRKLAFDYNTAVAQQLAVMVRASS